MVNQPYTGFRRIPYSRPCRVERKSGALQGQICNISVLGLYVSSDPLPDVGEDVQLSFPLPSGEPMVRCNAVVTWQNPEEPQKVDSLPAGCGLRFVALSQKDRTRIEELIEAFFAAGSGTPNR